MTESKRRPRSALLICNGEPPPRMLARRLASQAGLIIAADGGANTAMRHGIRPDVIIGDLDSLTPATRKKCASSFIIQVKRQDNTDLEKALDYLRGRKVREVSILGATGKRIDFTFANLSVMWNYTSSMRLVVMGEGWFAIPVVQRTTIRARRGTTVSLIPFGPCRGITLKGLTFPLSDAQMKVGEVGVSNVVSRSPFSVTVRQGKMLLFVMADRDNTVDG